MSAGEPGPKEKTAAKREISPRLLAVLVSLVAVLAFVPALFGEWIYDDRPLIEQNPFIKSFAHWKRWLFTDFWDVSEDVKRFGTRMIYWRPFVTATYALDWKLGSGSSVVFHVTNYLWHGLAALLAFVALRRWLGAVVPALFAALLFAVHPIKAESVAWIAGRTDVLCFVMVFLAAEGMARRLRGERHGLALEIAATVLAYMTKEQAVVLPVIAAVEVWVAAGRPALDRSVLVRMVRGAAPQLAIGVAYMGFRSKFLPIHGGSGKLFTAAYFGQLAETMGRYVVLAFAPHDLSVQQALVKVHEGKLDLHRGYVVAGVLATSALLALMVLARRARPAVSVGVGFFFATLLPTSNVIPMGMMTRISERFLYLPSLGLAVAIGAVLAELGALATRPRARAVGFALGGVAILALGAVSMRRSADYLDARRFWARELALHPDSLEAWRFAATTATNERRLRDALAVTARAQSVSAQWFGHTGTEADFIVRGVELLIELTPDRDTKALETYDAFLGDLLVEGDGMAVLATSTVRVQIPRGSPPIRRRLWALKPRIIIARAMLASRRGDDARAVELADAARRECPECTSQVGHVALVRARAGDYRGAHEALALILAREGEAAASVAGGLVGQAETYAKRAATLGDGPQKLQLRALELSQLEAWGRAYEVLAAHKEDIKQAPEFAVGFAELAYRAGHVEVAREVLEGVMPEPERGPTMAAWSRKMGWE